MWEQVKQAIVDNAREVRVFVRVRRKNPKNVLWNDVVKLNERRYYEIGMRSQKKDVWRFTKKKRE